MIVLVLTACPVGLRGDLTKWLLEISPGTFVGKVTARVRDELWERTCDLCKDGRALMVYSSDGEQKMRFKVHRHDWTPVDLEGLHLIRRPLAPGKRSSRRTGWSNASLQRKARNPNWRRRDEPGN